MRLSESGLTSVFHGGRLPHLLYLTSQQYGVERLMHTHATTCEVLLCCSGRGIYNVGARSYPVQKGDLMFYNAGVEHELLRAEGSDCETAPSDDGELESYSFGFSNVHFVDLPADHIIAEDSEFVRASGSQFEALLHLAELILRQNPEDPHDQVLIDTLAVSFLLLSKSVPEAAPARSVSRTSGDVTTLLMEYIAAHYTENISLDSMSEALNFSKTYLSRTFKKATGYSPIEYVIRRRIGYAETMLISSDLPVTHIATLAGYDNPNHFQAAFKKFVGETPLQFRKNAFRHIHGDRDQS